MNNELQTRLYEMEVIPPAAVWERLSLSVDEINADNVIAVKISTTEILPPGSIWQNVSMTIDEINSDNFISKKISGAEALPPATVWEKIKSSIGIAEETYPAKKGSVINFRRLAAAALFVGVIVAAWLLLRDLNSNDTDGLASGEKLIETTIIPDTNNRLIDSPLQSDPQSPSSEVKTSTNKNNLPTRRVSIETRSKKANTNPSMESTSNSPVLLINDAPGENSFNKTIDDLSLVTASDNYMTMVNSNGRLVKIPAEFAQLAPHLQDKPVREDIYEIMFGEGAYWKETLSEWRRKVISLPVTSGDAFNSFIELLKTVQEK